MIIELKTLLQRSIANKIVVFATDTVYGVGCRVVDLVTVRRIYDLKNREYGKPMAILCADIAQVESVAIMTEEALNLANKHWPGALTLVLVKKMTVNDVITSGMKTVGVRIPNDSACLAILKRFGPMVVTSLNQSNEPAILKYADVLKYDELVDYILKGGDLKNVASTVYDPANKKVIRQGEIVIE
jgi:L-threonylcarbamoyladenylate synthase